MCIFRLKKLKPCFKVTFLKVQEVLEHNVSLYLQILGHLNDFLSICIYLIYIYHFRSGLYTLKKSHDNVLPLYL